MWEIRPERADDAQGIEALLAASFGPGRYAKSAYRLREGVRAEGGLSFVAVEDGILRGSVRFWPVYVGANPALLLGPLAVDGAQRGRGIGIALMNEGIGMAQRLGHRAVLLVGDLSYYSRVGFSVLKRGSVRFPGPVDPGRVLGLALAEGGLEHVAGAVRRARIDEAVSADAVGWGPAPSALEF
jgi:predicted N-acetyltransferase YhbS